MPAVFHVLQDESFPNVLNIEINNLPHTRLLLTDVRRCEIGSSPKGHMRRLERIKCLATPFVERKLIFH